MASFETPSDNLYMKGLPAGLDEEGLRATFGAYGTVTSCKVLPCPAGVQDAAALVRMSSVQEAQWIVDQAQNIASALGVNSLLCRFANNNKGDKGKGDKGGGKGFSPAMPSAPPAQPGPRGMPSNRLYCKGFPIGMQEHDLRGIMAAYGNIISCKVLTPPPGAPDTACILQMGSMEEAQWLVDNLDTNIPQGLNTPVQIKFKQDSSDHQQAAGAQMGAPPLGQQYTPPQGITVMPPRIGATGSMPCDTIAVSGLPQGFNEYRVKEVLGVYGSILQITMTGAGPQGVSCTIRLATVDEAKWLCDNLNGNIPQGLSTPVSVTYADSFGGKGSCGKGSYVKGSPPPMDQRYNNNNSGWVPKAPQPQWQPSAPQWGDSGGKGGDKGKGKFGDEPSNNLYMKGLPLNCTEETLRTIFGAYGQVVQCKVLSSPPGVDDCAALVRMGTTQEAQWLVEHVNGNIPEGLGVPVQIRFASAKGSGKGKDGKDSFGGKDGGYGGPPPPQMQQSWNQGPPNNYGGEKGAPHQPSDNLYMKGFPADITEDALRSIMSPYGTIVSCKVLPPPPGKDSAACLVRLGSVDEAAWLVENMNGNIPQGMTTAVEVRFAANAGGKGGGKGKDWSSPY